MIEECKRLEKVPLAAISSNLCLLRFFPQKLVDADKNLAMSTDALAAATQSRQELQDHLNEADVNGKIQKGCNVAVKDTKLDACLCLASSLVYEQDPELGAALTELNALAAGSTAFTKDSSLSGRFLASKLLSSPFEDAEEEGRDATPSPPEDIAAYLKTLDLNATVSEAMTSCLKSGPGDVCLKIAAALCGAGTKVALPEKLVRAMQQAASTEGDAAHGIIRDALRAYAVVAPPPAEEPASTGEAEAEAEAAPEPEAPAEAEAEAPAEAAAEGEAPAEEAPAE